MLTMADLDAPGGVEKFARACAERSACMASLRFFAENKDRPLREVLLEMDEQEPDGPDWAYWAWNNLRGLASPAFRLHLLSLFKCPPVVSKHIAEKENVTPSERAFLEGRADG